MRMHMIQTWMKAPMLLVAFMANLSSTSAINNSVNEHEKEAKKPGARFDPRMAFYEKLNALMFVPQQELSREQAYWLPANERASQTSNPNRPVTPFVHKCRPPSQVLDSLRQYIPPPKRANWVKPTPLPKKKQVVHPNKQTNVCVPMSTGVKPTSGASKLVC
ncbi:hypothetical protein Tco_1261344 [Tanacetum coccineum]